VRLTIEQAARIMGGTAPNPDPSAVVTGASIDSRKIRTGDLFFALKGERVDGHTFVPDALMQGAAAAVVVEVRNDVDSGRQILVHSPAEGMIALAGWVRDMVNPVVVGITGSTGKTSVKDLLASILRPKRRIVASEGSFNNELGVPLTLMQIRSDTEVAVCEMGARGLGQIKLLCDLARPQVGVVTNVGVAHFELFGSQEAIANAKAELVRSLPEGGAAVLNADDRLVRAMAGDTKGEVLTYGIDQDAGLRAEGVRADNLGRPSFRMVRGDQEVEVSLGVSGLHQVSNSLAASAAALALGLTLEECREGLIAARLSSWRMEIRQVQGAVVVNDAYNANPTSMASALETCGWMVAPGGRLIAVLGYMAELGAIEAAEHYRVGELAAATVHRLVVVGSLAAPIAEGAEQAGLTDVIRVNGRDEAVDAIGRLAAGDVLLVKGSRIAALESVAGMVEERMVPA
jgi:UDP-N-acetylmuramoyl-tripeptide--D-alanyl-D-alanine ligase